ncbi:MAG: hypothetical protein AABZ12_05390 [Planctomycetota bacterium]
MTAVAANADVGRAENALKGKGRGGRIAVGAIDGDFRINERAARGT